MSTTVTAAVPLVHAIADLRERIGRWRAMGESVAMVPTMGALHAGHLSLVEQARRRAVRVAVTIFVNPAQFGPTEDFSKYPRTLEADLARLAEVETDLCFAPSVDEMYPHGFTTKVEVGGPAKVDLEDRFRPEHFSGVATIVAKLLNQAQADVAVFGEKDYQQLAVIRRLARDLDIPTQILSGPTLREPDGLAMSSRNVYLSAEERAAAPALYRELQACARRLTGGEPIGRAVKEAREAIAAAGFVIDYFEARHGETLAKIASREDGPLRLLVAARIGATRLIDNLAVGDDHD
jgi:pantoate--beta-alanine ligase